MLELRDVEFKVEASDGSELEIIDKINLTIEDGKFVVITGPNGGGKSTLDYGYRKTDGRSNFT